MSGILFINGNDAKTTYGFELVDAPELLAMGGHTYQTAPVVQRAGVLLGTARPAVEPRTLRLEGFITGSTLADAVTKLDNLKAACNTGPCRIATAWDTTRQYWGVLVSAPAGPNSAYWQTYMAVELEFLLFDPYAFKTTDSTVTFTTSAVAIPLGTAPSRGNRAVPSTITITGPATTPKITYRNSDGVEVSVMHFSDSVTGLLASASEQFEIDLARGLVRKLVSGTPSNAMGFLAPGWNFPALDPQDGNYELSAWPTLELTSGSGSVTYTKAYR
jgi:hypothetical protein